MNETESTECVVIGKTETEKSPTLSQDTTKKSGIYGLLCKITGKWYVGQTKRPISERMNDYSSLHCKGQIKIYNALKKYGYDGFDKVVLENCEPVPSILNEREDFWITQKNSIENGYNIMRGGIGSNNLTIWTDEKRKIASINSMGEKNPRYGKKWSVETREKIVKALMGKKLSEETKKKMSLTRANRKLSPSHCAAISKGVKGLRRTPEQCMTISIAIKEMHSKKRLKLNE
jgi:group I intron endonuclease